MCLLVPKDVDNRPEGAACFCVSQDVSSLLHSRVKAVQHGLMSDGISIKGKKVKLSL
jgi:hypothetical protein